MTINRRQFLTGGAALGAIALVGCPGRPRRDRIGLALGGGGARGLAHVMMLEVLEEFGIRPNRIAGSSIGAIIGSMYASGMSARAIREQVDELVTLDPRNWLGAIFSEEIVKWFELIQPALGGGGLVDSEAFINFLRKTLGVSRFEDLEIPLKVVATDFWARRQVVFTKGELFPAVKASMALPGIFEPVTLGGRVYVDGGVTNPVPYDLLLDESDAVIAIDVLGEPEDVDDLEPSYFETVINSFQIMQDAIVQEKLRRHRPAIYIKPEISGVRVMEFYRAEDIYRQSEAARNELRQRLRRLVGQPAAA